MFGKNRKKTVGLCVMVVTSCFILAALWAVLAAPETALAAKGGGKGGGGGKETRTYQVTFTIQSETASGCREMSLINPEDNVGHLWFDEPYLNLSPVIGGVDGFDICFSGGAEAKLMHGLFRDKHDLTKVNGTLFFPGLDKTGKEIKYRLDFTGTVIAGTWTPPDIDTGNNTATIRLDTWELKHDTGGKKNACSGEGDFGVDGIPITTILVERLSACPPPP